MRIKRLQFSHNQNRNKPSQLQIMKDYTRKYICHPTRTSTIKCTLLILFVFFPVLCNHAKERYLAKYNTTINEKTDGSIHTESCNYSNEFSMNTLQGKLTITVCHETITSEKEKILSSMRTTANLYAMSSMLSGLSGLFTGINGMTTKSQTERMKSMASADKALLEEMEIENLKNLNVVAILQNNTDEELLVNELDKGLSWFIQAHSEAIIPITSSDKKLKLRASTIQLSQQPISIIDITAISQVNNFDILYEDDDYLYYSPQITTKTDDVYELSPIKAKYYRVCKKTSEEDEISEKEYKAISSEKK